MKVFISHASTDKNLAKRVADTLRASGFQVWDDTQVLPGENWAESLSKALEESDAMVVLLTPHAASSSNISHEVGYALGRQEYKGRLIPVIAAPEEQFESGDIPWVFNLDPFRVIHAANLADDEEGLRSIAQAVQAIE